MNTESEAWSLQAHLDAFAQQEVSATPAEAMLIISGFIARQAVENLAGQSLHIGSHAPAFTLPSASGADVALAALLELGPVVLTFYRGAWCPYCDLTLRAYQRALPEFSRYGASIVAVSPQTPATSRATAEQKELTFALLSDTDNRVARQYGLAYRLDDELKQTYFSLGIDLTKYNGTAAWELPLTGTFIIAPNGTIALTSVHENYMQRLDSVQIIAALQDLRQ